jgi:CRISPR/Cas system CMR-associated protein Cmr3 (group 5 of RAMP superfamily)
VRDFRKKQQNNYLFKLLPIFELYLNQKIMNSKEQKEIIKNIKTYSEQLLNSEVESKKFFISAGIHTQSGKLTKIYSYTETKIGFKTKSK